jgi:hypothetical protein
METRRIRRRERQRTLRTTGLTVSLAIAGLAVGLALPRNPAAAVLLAVLAVTCLALVVARDESIAPLHGLHHVVRFPLHQSIVVTADSLWSRVTGSLRIAGAHTRAVAGKLRPEPTPLVLDEADDEAEAWWGVPAADAVADRPELPGAVYAVPLQTARVPAEPFRTNAR